jgi:hypothetical protein
VKRGAWSSAGTLSLRPGATCGGHQPSVRQSSPACRGWTCSAPDARQAAQSTFGRLTVREFVGEAAVLKLPEAAIVNCTGLGTRNIWTDPKLYPVKGHLVLLRPQPRLKYLFSGRSCVPWFQYVFPRRDAVVLGGTYQRYVEDEDPSQDTCDKLLAQLESLFKATCRPRAPIFRRCCEAQRACTRALRTGRELDFGDLHRRPNWLPGQRWRCRGFSRDFLQPPKVEAIVLHESRAAPDPPSSPPGQHGSNQKHKLPKSVDWPRLSAAVLDDCGLPQRGELEADGEPFVLPLGRLAIDHQADPLLEGERSDVGLAC